MPRHPPQGHALLPANPNAMFGVDLAFYFMTTGIVTVESEACRPHIPLRAVSKVPDILRQMNPKRRGAVYLNVSKRGIPNGARRQDFCSD